jgi:hypothetical protein
VLEICGDQAAGRARIEHEKSDPRAGGAKADLALLRSHGAGSPMVSNAMVKSGGIALHADSTPKDARTSAHGTSAAYTLQPDVLAKPRVQHFQSAGHQHLGNSADPERLHSAVLAQ